MVDPPPPRVFLRSTAVRDGLSDGELARAVRSRQLVRLQRGAYLDRPPTGAGERHRAVIAATLSGLTVPGVVSHGSAAILHGLPLWRVPVERVHLTRAPPTAGSSSRRLHLHVARFPAVEVVDLDGVAVTDVTRTVVDLARSVPFESAVVTADAALAQRATTSEQLSRCLAAMGPVPGTRRAARVIAFADPHSESVGESRSRVLLHRLGLPSPVLQLSVRRDDGTLVGRADFGWDEFRTVGEFDGRVKYGRLLRPGQDPGDVVFAEKRREDELRDLGWQVVRWTWSDLEEGALIEQRLRRAFLRGRRSR